METMMTADELRSLADTLEQCSPFRDSASVYQAANYLRACADARDVGPVAWHYDGRDQIEVYPLAMPAAIRLPEPMTEDDVHRVSGAQRDAMLDHIYEYGTGAEGIMQRVTQLARAIEAETLRRVKEANE